MNTGFPEGEETMHKKTWLTIAATLGWARAAALAASSAGGGGMRGRPHAAWHDGWTEPG